MGVQSKREENDVALHHRFTHSKQLHGSVKQSLRTANSKRNTSQRSSIRDGLYECLGWDESRLQQGSGFKVYFHNAIVNTTTPGLLLGNPFQLEFKKKQAHRASLDLLVIREDSHRGIGLLAVRISHKHTHIVCTHTHTHSHTYTHKHRERDSHLCTYIFTVS